MVVLVPWYSPRAGYMTCRRGASTMHRCMCRAPGHAHGMSRGRHREARGAQVFSPRLRLMVGGDSLGPWRGHVRQMCARI